MAARTRVRGLSALAEDDACTDEPAVDLDGLSSRSDSLSTRLATEQDSLCGPHWVAGAVVAAKQGAKGDQPPTILPGTSTKTPDTASISTDLEVSV